MDLEKWDHFQFFGHYRAVATMPWSRARRIKRGWLDKYQYDEEDSTAGPTITTFIPTIAETIANTTFFGPGTDDIEATTDAGSAHLVGGKNVPTKAKALSNKKLFIILAVAAAILVLLIAAVVVMIMFVRKRRMRQRLGAKLDEEERLRQERAKEGKKNKKKKKKKGKNAEDEANEGEKQADDKEKSAASALKEPSAMKSVKSQLQDPKNDEKKSLMDKPNKESNEPNAADIDHMMEMLGNRKMEELMKDPSLDANPADVNKMVKEMMERRMQRARDNA